MTPNGWFIACSQRSLLSLDFLLFFQSYVDYIKRSCPGSCANRSAVSRIASLGPGIRWMMHPDWMGVVALLTIIVSVTVIGYREGHSILKRRV